MRDDFINRQEVIQAIRSERVWVDENIQNPQHHYHRMNETTRILSIVGKLPSVQLKTGQWKEILVHRDDEGDILRDYECTNCLGIICDVPDDDEKELPRFCCMCGAEMEERWSE